MNERPDNDSVSGNAAEADNALAALLSPTAQKVFPMHRLTIRITDEQYHALAKLYPNPSMSRQIRVLLAHHFHLPTEEGESHNLAGLEIPLPLIQDMVAILQRAEQPRYSSPGKIQAIKHLRTQMNLHLKTAKNVVDALCDEISNP